MPGAISFNNSSHFPLRPYSKFVNPVVFPPGRARLATKPEPTGSTTATNTIGAERVACCNATTATLLLARMTSGASPTNSAAYPRKRSVSPSAQRVSILKLRPMAQPNSASSWSNAPTRA